MSDYNAFIQANTNVVKVYVPKNVRLNGGSVLASYQNAQALTGAANSYGGVNVSAVYLKPGSKFSIGMEPMGAGSGSGTGSGDGSGSGTGGGSGAGGSETGGGSGSGSGSDEGSGSGSGSGTGGGSGTEGGDDTDGGGGTENEEGGINF